MLVRERMTKDVCCCQGTDTLAEAARHLWERDCGCLPVVDEHGHVHGMLTDRDICMAAYTTGRNLAELHVRDAMAHGVATTHPAESLRDAELRMRTKAVRRLPVIDEQRRIVGMLSLNDLFRRTDDAGAGATSSDAVHLVHTVAVLGRSRRHAASPAAATDQPAARPGTSTATADHHPPRPGTPPRGERPAKHATGEAAANQLPG